MRLLEIRVTAFKALRDTRLRFTDYSGLVGVEGHVVGAGGLSSNGASKSSLFLDAPAWVLFGKCVQEQKAAADVCNRATGKAEVELDVELDSGRVITVARRRSGGDASLTVSGLSTGTPSGRQEALERMLGMDFDLWVRTVAFSRDYALCRKSDAEKKATLEKLLGLSRYSRAREVAVEKAREARNRLEKIEAIIGATKENDSTVVANLKALSEDETRYSRRMARQIDSISFELGDVYERFLDKIDEVGNLTQRVDHEEAEYQRARTAWKGKMAAAEKSVERLRELSSDGSSAAAVASDRYQSARRAYRSALEGDHPELCPHCGQRWPRDQGVSEHLEGLRQAMKVAEEALESATSASDKSKEAVTRAKAALAGVVESEPQPSELRARLVEARQELNETLRPAIRERATEIKNLRSRLGENPYTLQVQQLKDQHAVNLHTLRVQEEKAAASRTEVDTYEFWVTGFSKSGIPSYLIDNSLPFLNDAVHRMVSIMTDGVFKVLFDPTVEGGRGAKGQQLGIVVTNRTGGDQYHLQSDGEKARIDVCVLLSILRLLEQRISSGVSQVFIDEVFDGLDSEGVARVSALLRAEFPDHTFFILSHKDGLKASMDDTVLIRKVGDVAKVVHQKSSPTVD